MTPILSKAMLRKINLREGEQATEQRASVAKITSKGLLCRVKLGVNEAKNFSVFLNECM